ncbi:MAG: Arylsulfatase, partial [uncultured Rubrobacteraceae bacterium]
GGLLDRAFPRQARRAEPHRQHHRRLHLRPRLLLRRARLLRQGRVGARARRDGERELQPAGLALGVVAAHRAVVAAVQRDQPHPPHGPRPRRGSRPPPGHDHRPRHSAHDPRPHGAGQPADDEGRVLRRRAHWAERRAPAVRGQLVAAVHGGGGDHDRRRLHAPQGGQLHALHRHHPRTIRDPGRPQRPARALRPPYGPGRDEQRLVQPPRRGRIPLRRRHRVPRGPGDTGTTPDPPPRSARRLAEPGRADRL